MGDTRGYVFDSDVLGVVLRGRAPRWAKRRLDALPPSVRLTTSINVGELLYGAHREPTQRWLGPIRHFLADFRVLPFDQPAAERYAALRTELERRGMPLDEADLRIAAITLVAGATLVTGNIRHFERVTGLSVENWLEDDTE